MSSLVWSLGFSDPEKEKKQDVVGYIEVDHGPEENAHGPFKSYGPGGILWVSFLRNLGGNLMHFFLVPFHAFFFFTTYWVVQWQELEIKEFVFPVVANMMATGGLHGR